jgi:alpha-glucosidase (family GH31 glycosyl hydrolase)
MHHTTPVNWCRRSTPYTAPETTPLFVREGAILVLGKPDETGVEYNYLNDIEIRVYGVKEGAESSIRTAQEIGYIEEDMRGKDRGARGDSKLECS